MIFARVENGVTKLSPKKQKTRLNFGYQKQQFSVGKFYFFGRGKTNFGGGDITSKLASQ